MSSQQRHLEHKGQSGSKISIAIEAAFRFMHQTQPKTLEEEMENQLQRPGELTVNHSALLQRAYNFKTK